MSANAELDGCGGVLNCEFHCSLRGSSVVSALKQPFNAECAENAQRIAGTPSNSDITRRDQILTGQSQKADYYGLESLVRPFPRHNALNNNFLGSCWVGESNLEALVGTELGRSILSSEFAIAVD